MSKIQNTSGQGHYNSSAFTLSDGNVCGFQFDINGNLKTAGSTTVTVASDGATGAAVPTKASFIAGSDYAGSPILNAWKIDSVGTGRVDIVDALPAGTNTIGLVKLQDGSGTNISSTASALDVNLKTTSLTIVPVGGSVASNVAITDNPLNLGAQGLTAEASAVTTTRKVQLVADKVGKLNVLPYALPENFTSGAITSAMTGTTTTSLLAAPAGSLRNYITQITVSNSHATVSTDIIIQDGSGGTTLYTIPAAAAYGGATISFPVPLRQPTAATAIFCANVTTGSNTKVSASGYQGL